MARIRTVRPEFWSDPGLFRISRDARLAFIASWTFADDYGVFEDEPDRLRFQAFAGDVDADVEGWLTELVQARMLEPVEGVNGEPLLRIRNFATYQKIDRPSKTRHEVKGTRTREGSGVLPSLSASRPSRRPASRDEAAAPKGRKRPKTDPDALPAKFPEALAGYVEPVLDVLTELAEGTGATLPTRRGVGLALADYPRRDHVAVARSYRAWQLDGAKRPHKNVVTGYRNQLDMANDVARRAAPPAAPKSAEDKAAETRRRMEEAE